jgi:hypothetical protein
MQNTVVVAPYSFKVTKTKNKPFGNNFNTIKAIVSTMQANEIECVVKCTANSKDPNRSYYCIYSTSGELLACNTLD